MAHLTGGYHLGHSQVAMLRDRAGKKLPPLPSLVNIAAVGMNGRQSASVRQYGPIQAMSAPTDNLAPWS